MIELKNEELCVQFSTLGGQMTSIKDTAGVEYLWQGNPEYWSGQAPVLFPICGSVRNDRVRFSKSDVEVTIPRHGLVRKREFKLEEQTEDSVTFSITSDDKLMENYPFRFKLTICYTLTKTRVRTTYRVTNLESDQVLPYFVGGHPGFNCPLVAGESYEDYYLEFEQFETCSVPKSFPDTGLLDRAIRTPLLDNQNDLPLNYELFAQDAITLDQLQSKKVTLKSKKHSLAIRLEFEDFPYLIIWSTTNQSPFIALEPWSGLSTSLAESDQFEEKENVSWVSPGTWQEKSFDIVIEN